MISHRFLPKTGLHFLARCFNDVLALLADPCVRHGHSDQWRHYGSLLKPDVQRLVPRLRRESRRYRLGEVFLNAACASGSDFGCCGRDLQPQETQRCRPQADLADAPLVQDDAEVGRDATLQVTAPPRA